MAGSMFNSIIYGPISNAKLGRSLGINLLPFGAKICSFDCLYCACGSEPGQVSRSIDLPSTYAVVEQLMTAVQDSLKRNEVVDAIAFLGNGEPTLHPDFDQIVADVVLIRNLLLPDTKIVVFTNATTILNPLVKKAIAKADQFVVKYDAGGEDFFQRVNRPLKQIEKNQITSSLLEFKGGVSIQAKFLKLKHRNKTLDNSTDEQVQDWLKHIKSIAPRKVYLSSVEKAENRNELAQVSKRRLNEIASMVQSIGIETKIT